MAPQGDVSGATPGELDALEQIMDRMNRTSSPAPSFSPPPRTSSRASSVHSTSHARLSTHSSTHSLHSVRSVSPRPSSPLVRPASRSNNDDESEPGDETTPSMRQGEWGPVGGASRTTTTTPIHQQHSRARTTSDNRAFSPRNFDDDTSSLRSPRNDESSSLYGTATSAAATAVATTNSIRWSPHTSPPLRPRPSPSLSATTPASSASVVVGQSPVRLLPRSPLNDRAPLDDLAFLREAGAFAAAAVDEDYSWSTLDEIRSRATGAGGGDTDSSSIHSANSASLRNARLREDIERTAQKIKERESIDAANRAAALAAAAASPPPPAAVVSQTSSEPEVEAPPSLPASRRPSLGGFASSSLPLYPGAPIPAVPSYDESFDDRSIYSLASTTGAGGGGADGSGGSNWTPNSSNYHFQHYSGIAAGAGGASPRYEYARGGGGVDRQPPRVRQRESKEWSQACWIWLRDKGSPKESSSLSSGVSKFSKAPLIRDVPSVMKRKSGKRESAHHLLSPAEAMLFNFDDPSGGGGGSIGAGGSKSGGGSSSSGRSSSSRDKVRDKGGKPPVGPSGARDKEGTWRRATGVLRDDGYFRIFGESDKVVIHSIHLPSYNRTDVRLSDHSLFGRPNCISISRRTSSPVTPFRSSFASPVSSSATAMSASLSGSGSPRSSTLDGEAVYLCFPSVVATQVWLVMLHCFAQSEFYLASGGAATPRQLPLPVLGTTTSSSRRSRDPSWPSSDEVDEGEGERRDGTDGLESSCRIFRKLHLTINEGRALGESMTEANRPGAKPASWDRSGGGYSSREGSSNHADATPSSTAAIYGNDLQSPGGASSLDSPSKSIAGSFPTSVRSKGGADSGNSKDDHSGSGWLCEVEMNGEVVARTAVRRGSSAFWNESFSFSTSDLPPFTAPITIRVLQSSKGSSRLQVLGIATVRVPDLPRHELHEDWWSIKPINSAKLTDVVGELNLGIKVGEEVVLPSRAYETILKLLTEDRDAELAVDISQEFPSELEELTSILLRIYQAESVLLSRLLRLADLEIDSNNRLNRSTAILFRGNTVLTKSVELYLRLIGAEYLEASIGETIRKIIKDKVEIEIDPMKLKSGYKDKELLANVHALHEWTTTLWNSIYDARERCPQDLRQIFGHIQRIVVERYGAGEDQKNTRWTSVSAFIFLRFFVPAVLNPRLFFIVSNPPDAKSQRTLTLIAKTLQGLANFSSFGQKEPWMLPMNSFVQDNGAAFVDFIEHVATPAPAAAHRQEWTSPLASTYLAPYRLRHSLSPLAKEGVPLLPHLIDLPRELGLLATHLARWHSEQLGHDRTGSNGVTPGAGRTGTPSVSSSRGGSSARFQELAEACAEAHDEARRRGGGLVSALNYYDLRSRQPDLRTRVGGASRMTGRPATSSGVYGAGTRPKVLGGSGPARPSTASMAATEELLHIRNPTRPITPPPRSQVGTAPPEEQDEFEETGGDKTAKRRSHRSFTINGASPGRSVVSGGVLRSLSTEDLARLAAIQTRPSLEALDTDRTASSSKPTVSPSTPLASGGLPDADDVEGLRSARVRRASDFLVDDVTLCDPDEARRGSDASFQFSQQPLRGNAPTSVAMNKASSTHSTSTVSSTNRSTPRIPPPPLPPPVTGVRINQKTTISTAHVSHFAPGLDRVPLGNSVSVSAVAAHPPASSADMTTLHEADNGQSSYVTTTNVAPPLRSPVTGPLSSPLLASRSTGGAFPSSVSSMSISAEVSAPSAPAMGRRSSSAGMGGIMGSFGLGKSSKHSSSSSSPTTTTTTTGAADDEGTSSGSGGSRAGGLLSRAMGRKGSRAS